MQRLRRVFAAIALALVAGPLIASAPLFDPDEGLHAAIAQEMVQRGDYVTPTFLGEPFLDKPILFFWAEAASLRLFGRSEFAVRIPPLLFGLLGMLSVALLGRSLFGPAAGMIAGYAYGTMLLPFAVSQLAVHDIALVPFMCLAAWCLVVGLDRRIMVVTALLAGVCLGLSILTKGLVGCVFVCIFAVCLALRRPHAIPRLVLTLTVAAVVAAMIAAPWYIAMEHAHPGYLHYYFIERHLQGYLTATQRHAGRPWWYYVPVVLGGTLPWTAYLVTAARPAGKDSMRLAVWGWFALGLVFLSLGESKLVTYALPLFPALALLIGDVLQTGGAPSRFAFGVHAGVLVLVPAAGLVALRWKFDASYPFLWPVIAAGAAVTLYICWRAIRSRTEYGYLSWMGGAAIVSLIAVMIIVPRAAAWMTGKDLAAALNTAGALPSHVSVLNERVGSLVFYLDPPLRAQASRERLTEVSFPEAIAGARGYPDDALLAVRAGELERFNRLFPHAPTPDARAGMFTIFRALTLRETLHDKNPPK